MVTFLDILYVAFFAAAGPLIDYAFFWPAFRSRSLADPVRARRWFWAWTIGFTWPLVAVGAAIWVANGRSWASFGFSVPGGWRMWASLALVLLFIIYMVQAIAGISRNAEARESVRRQLFGDLAAVVPRSRNEMYWFAGVALTAGFCEEFLFRGYFIWVLSPWLGWWGAAALSLLIFAGAHAYQGWNGILRTGALGAVFTMMVAITGSLWPAVVIHSLWDLGMGFVAWFALRDEQAASDVT